MSDRPETPLLDQVEFPADLRALSKEQLPQLADELRQETISAVSVTGGHLGAGLGVIELTVALHYVFDTPNDKLIWDVGHQAYPHKIVTGRGAEKPALAAALRMLADKLSSSTWTVWPQLSQIRKMQSCRQSGCLLAT